MHKIVLGFSLFLSVIFQLSVAASPLKQQDRSIAISLTINGENPESIQLDTSIITRNKDGNLKVELALETARYVNLKIRNTEVLLFAEPRRDIYISLEADNINSTIKFGGPNAVVNTFLHDHRGVNQRFNSYFNKKINSYLSKLDLWQGYIFTFFSC
jgi:hypothetical protein